MIPAWRKQNVVETEEEVARNREIKKRIINELSVTVKELQKAHLDGDIDIDKNDQYALMLCTLIEAVLLHGYQEHGIKMSNFYNLLGKISSESMPSHSFWNFLVHFTHKDIIQELQHLSHVTTPIGQCRAWVRLALNDCLMESYLDAMLSDTKKIKMYYKPSAFMLEEELPYIMISFLQGLTEFKFNLNYNTPSLNTWTGDTLALTGIWQLPQYASHSPQPQVTPSVLETHRVTSSQQTSSSAQAQRPLAIPHMRSISDEIEVARSVHEGTEGAFPGGQHVIEEENHVEREVVIEELNSEPDDQTDMIEEKPAPAAHEEVSNHTSTDEKKDQLPNPETDRSTVISPVPMMGSNKLGVSIGWSSAFDTNTAPSTTTAEQPETPGENKTNEQSAPQEGSKLQRVQPTVGIPSYTNLLSNYTVQGQANFDTAVYEEEDGGNQTTGKVPIPRPISPEQEDPQMPGFEVVPHSSSVHSEHADDRTHFLMSILTQISNEKGLDSQNYQCRGCGRNIGMIYGEAKVCRYDGCYYCYECHIDDEHVIPARIIYNWDLRKHKVCRATKLFLLQIEEEPLLNIDETNPLLYGVVEELQEIKMLRKQLIHLKGFLFTCKDPIADDVRRRIWPREYLWDDLHQYSLLDLIQTNSGQLAHHLKKVISYCQKHVYKCRLCCQKGFICEFCNDPKIIYPFQVKTTTQCPECKAVYHKPCIADRNCPKCARRRKKKAATALESTALEFDSPW